MNGNFQQELVHISMIRVGDIVIHGGRDRTICKANISTGFMGKSIFGDSYNLGYKPVVRLRYIKP